MLPRIKLDEEDIGKLLAVFESEMMTNPFVVGTTEKPLPLINFATGVVAPEDISCRLVNEKAIGTTQMKPFVDQRINTNQLHFWDPIKKVNIRTFSTMVKKKQLKTADEKVITVSADQDLFGRLIVAATARDIDLKSVFTFELSSVPFSLFHANATLRKTCKSNLLAELEKYGEALPQLPFSTVDHKMAYVIDGMALIQMMKTSSAATFGDLAQKHYQVITGKLDQPGCKRVDIVFDQYRDRSIKSGERNRRDANIALEVKINCSRTPLPKQ